MMPQTKSVSQNFADVVEWVRAPFVVTVLVNSNLTEATLLKSSLQ